MYHSLSIDDTSFSESSFFFPELEENYHDSFYDEFDEDLIAGSLPMVKAERFSYLENVYGNSDDDDSDINMEQGGNYIEDMDETETLDTESEMTEDIEATIERLSQEMEEEEFTEIRQEFNETQNVQNEISLCRTKSGRAATVIMEGVDENEHVGLLQYESGAEEFRRSQSYQVGFEDQKTKTNFPWLQAAPTFKMDKFGNFVMDTSTVDSPVQAKKPAMFAPPSFRTRSATDHGNTMGRKVNFGHVEVQKNRRTSNAVRFEEQTRFECAEPIQRQITKHSNVHKKRARFEENVVEAQTNKIQRQVTQHANARKIRFTTSNDQNQPNKIQRQVTKHTTSVLPRQIRFDSRAKSCGGEVIQRQVTKHARVLF